VKPLTREQVSELLSYDPQTGVFIWKKSRGGKRAGDVAGSINTNGHRLISINERRYVAHWLAWLMHHGVWPHKEIGHRDRNPDNNRISNPRLATRQENCRNGSGRHGGSSKFRGVSRASGGKKWKAYLRLDGKQRYIGRFESEIDAAHAYDAAARTHYGEFAVLNFPAP
jgi:HNH endonuclease